MSEPVRTKEDLLKSYENVSISSAVSDEKIDSCPSDNEWSSWLEYLSRLDVKEVYKREPSLINAIRKILKEAVVLDTSEYDEYYNGVVYDVMFQDQFNELAKQYPEIEQSELLKKIFIYDFCWGLLDNYDPHPYDFKNHKWTCNYKEE